VENYLDVVNADGSNFNDKFLKDIKEKIAEIFNPEIPFRQTDNKGDDKNCKYCNFKSICGIKDSDW
ncbi:MAG: PD-(D/E)XK nuclease family protein, partial [Muribaculaceae bacterium]|nr:PD-(D/E)XK nuclease family protein [Muribaculaceae bacterium]